MKPTIILIVGASGSGKTYLSKYLQHCFGVFTIVSHTTRPKREGEIEGEDYYFVKSTKNINRNQMLSHTRFAGCDYFALEDQVPPQRISQCVVEENGLKYLKDNKSHKYNIISIRVESESCTLINRGIDEDRILRDKDRELLPLEYYNYIIDNNGSQEEFDNKIRDTYNKISKWQHQK